MATRASIIISGNSAIGETLTATVSGIGVPASGIRYQWYYAGSSTDPIKGATARTYTPTAADAGKQIRVEAVYTDHSNTLRTISSEDYTPVAYAGDGGSTGGLFIAEDAPTVTLSGPAEIKEGSRSYYTVTLDKAADKPVSVDVGLVRDTASAADVRLSTGNVVIRAGESKASFYVSNHADDSSGSNKSYHVEISRAVIGDTPQGGAMPSEKGAVAHQALIPVTYSYPKTDSGAFSDYWTAVWKAGKDNVPYVLINPANGPSAAADSDYAELLAKNAAEGFQNIAYVSTTYQTRPIGSVKADIDQYFALYGKDKIHGFFFDEISAARNSDAAYLAEVYNYVKAQYGSGMLVIANPGMHIHNERITPYADIFVTAETSAAQYLGQAETGNYPSAASSFENDPANAHRIWHMVYGAEAGQYGQIRKVSRTRNAGWLFITDDQTGDRYDNVPTGFVRLARETKLGDLPDPTVGSAVRSVLQGAKIGNSRIDTVIIDKNAVETDIGGTPTVNLSGAESVHEGGRANYFVTLDKPAAQPVTVGIRISHITTTQADARIRWHWKEVTVKAGTTKAFFIVDAAADGIVEGNETYRVEISHAHTGSGNVNIGTAGIETVIIDNAADTILPSDPPTVNLSGAESVREGGRANYFVTLDKPAAEPVTVGIKMVYNDTTPADARIRWHWKEVTVKAGAAKAFFIVDAAADGIAEGNETYRVEISHAHTGRQNAKIGTSGIDTVIIDGDTAPESRMLAARLDSLGDTTFTGSRNADASALSAKTHIDESAAVKGYGSLGSRFSLEQAVSDLTQGGWSAADSRHPQTDTGVSRAADGSAEAYATVRFAAASVLKDDDSAIHSGIL